MPSPGEGPGGSLFRERTALAWQRSALSFAAIAGVTLGAAAHHRRAWLLAPAVALLGVALAVWRHARVAGPLPQSRPLRLVTAATTAAAGLAAVVVIVVETGAR
jgi:uncharacterized membrane protein YidH (DUF202 family)